MNSNEISAMVIGLSIFTFVIGLFLFGYYKNRSFFTNQVNFYVKKWLYITFVVCLNVAGCAFVYYYQDVQVIIYIILALKSKDLISSIVFVFNMLYKHLFTNLQTPLVDDKAEVKRIVAFVPVYDETIKQLLRTIDSILENNVTPNYLLTCVVSDGKNDFKDIMDNIIVSKIGYKYKSWKGDDVFTNIFYGTRNGNHICLIEKGMNMGKKDSIILANDVFNTKQNNVSNDGFKKEVTDNLASVFGVSEFDYMFVTDADTVIDRSTILCLLDSIIKRNAVASCGVVNVDQSSGNWLWNNLQNFQYLYGQYVRRTTEDLCNQVLCLPGCISMFRLCDKNLKARSLYSEIPNKDNVIVSSVQYVGTDRRYTSSLVYTESDSKIVMDTRCNAYTLPPQSFNAYVSQRRRWCQNTYFNTMLNIVSPNVNLMLRFFCLVDYLRLTLLYFRLFNTIFFVYLLASGFNQNYDSLIALVPYLVILVYPVVFFFLYCLFNSHLRIQWFNLLVSYLINKVFILLSNLVIFTIMLLNIGCDSWSSTNTNTNNDMTQVVVS